ncbi:MAG: iron ABC transporter permease [Treponema sp.]|nr:iron ABC transporter permease [Treponema sp.]
MKTNIERFLKTIPLFILIFLCVIAVCTGTKFINPFLLLSDACSKTDFTIVTRIRLPRVLLSVLCGALLGGTGAVFQGFFRNPLADAGIMGVSSGATFGALLAGGLSFSFCSFLSPVSFFAFAGAVVSSLCVYGLSKIFRESSSVTLLLSGTAVGTFFSAVSSILLMTRDKNFHSFYAWTMGSFNAKGWDDFFMFVIPSVIALILLVLWAEDLDVLSCGEDVAQGLGLDYKKTEKFVLLAGSLAASSAVCAGGIISFVGLIAPHLVRKIYGPKHNTLIVQSMVYGAAIMILSDTLARTVLSPAEIPVGIVTSLIGVPFFIFVLVQFCGERK